MRHTATIGLVIGALSLSGCAIFQAGRVTPPAVAGVCTDVVTSIYFGSRSSSLSREARQVLKAQVKHMEGCTVSAVDVTGLTDAIGDPATNQLLAERRTETVTRMLARYGFSKVMFDPASVGERGSMTPGGLSRPMRRRVDLTFHLKSEAQPAKS